tara:strand:+ start:304 stop:495 length:192 start_codon:yes stop_codon:yes gene_type:complete
LRIEDFLRILKEEQAAIAHETVTAPNADPFVYGRAVGMHAGLERAMALILGKHDEQERRDNNL